jgi:hypothetical protein
LVTAAWSDTAREALDWPAPPGCPPDDRLVADWLVDDWLVDDWPVADWLVDDWLVDDWPVDDRLADDRPGAAAGTAAVDALVPAVVIARVTDVMRAVWLRTSACWSR